MEGRNGEIWRGHCAGMTQDALASKHGLSQQRVSQILAAVRASIPAVEKEALYQREIDLLDQLRVKATEILSLPAAPVTAGKDGAIVRDPETGAVVRDYAGQLAAIDRIVKTHERLAKLLGLDAATKVDMSVSQAEVDAATSAAAAAMARLHGDTP